MDPTQLVLTISIAIITIILATIGIYLIKILKEIKITISKTNLILDDTQIITSSIAQPVSTFAEFFSGLRDGVQALSNLFNK
ncbi:hypothetical protein KKC08_01015 [Patescibacteria group bacterium]|nr:hypothetical protein [Patescibacteria group bacterium]MCG2701554.1 hypothetical protein [Candidatus Parcubacteria bacterium]MBU4264478.1 hypothetical protein [Patescibacteria group bacterium]MBU4390409.1 hypothetical protein [Patescibacteria group bacterium]MBU4396734.1 hypothetical protein [Patescibacteria group bacterium]